MFWFDFSWDIQNFLNQFWWQINFLLLVLVVSLGYLAYKQPVYAVGLTIILLPTYLLRSKVWFLPVTFLEVCIWILFLGWLLHTIKNKTFKFPTATIYRWPILLIILASTIGLAKAPDLIAAAGLWKAYFIEPLLFFIVLINVLKNKDNQKIVLWALGISTLTISWLAIYQKFTGFGIFEPSWIGADGRRVTSIFSSPNAIGLYLVPTIALYLGWALAEIKYLKETALKLLVIIPAVLAICFSLSVGAWLALGAAVVFLAFFGWNKKWTALAVLLLIIISLAVPISRELLMPIVTFQDVSGQNRLALWGWAKDSLIQNPIFGNGILGFAQIQNQLRDPLKLEPLLYPHNILLNFWTEIGLLGVAGFALVIWKFFKTGFKKLQTDKWLTLGIMAAMVTILVHGLIDVPYFKNDLSILFWVVIGLL